MYQLIIGIAFAVSQIPRFYRYEKNEFPNTNIFLVRIRMVQITKKVLNLKELIKLDKKQIGGLSFPSPLKPSVFIW